MKLSPHDERRLAVHLHRELRAIRNAYLGVGKELVRQHVREGARELGLPPPPAADDEAAFTAEVDTTEIVRR